MAKCAGFICVLFATGAAALCQSSQIAASNFESASGTVGLATTSSALVRAVPAIAAHGETLPYSRRTPSAGSVGAQSGIVFTCDPNVTTNVCATLNTTTAGLYASAFTNADASIYVKFGATKLGQSQFPILPVDYAVFRDALQNAQAGPDDATAFASSVPPTNPIKAGTSVALTNPLARALGIAPPSGGFQGFQTDGTTACSLGIGASAGCFDGVITISESLYNAGLLYFRTNPQIMAGQYDFYTAVEHETDEILGTPSCAFGCPNHIFPSDLYRYQANGARSFGSEEAADRATAHAAS